MHRRNMQQRKEKPKIELDIEVGTSLNQWCEGPWRLPSFAHPDIGECAIVVTSHVWSPGEPDVRYTYWKAEGYDLRFWRGKEGVAYPQIGRCYLELYTTWPYAAIAVELSDRFDITENGRSIFGRQGGI